MRVLQVLKSDFSCLHGLMLLWDDNRYVCPSALRIILTASGLTGWHAVDSKHSTIISLETETPKNNVKSGSCPASLRSAGENDTAR